MRGTVWTLANRLGVVAGTPGELLAALLEAERRPERVTVPDRGGCAALARELGALTGVRVVVTEPPEEPGPRTPLDLGDPASVCAGDPVRITAAYEAEAEAGAEAGAGDGAGDAFRGGLRRAWLRAGQSLIRGQAPADRALVLLAALDAGADPRLRPALAELSAGTRWRVRWSRSGGGRPVTALTVHEGRPLVAEERVTALAVLADGTRLGLDERGRLRVRGGPPAPLARAVAATLERHPATALAAAGDTVLAGDRTGTVHAFGPGGVHQAALHSGRVTALAATASPSLSAYSGGADGTVRSWHPGGAPRRTPVTGRPYPVVALHAADTAGGRLLAVAWADGLAELHRPEAGEVLSFRPGPRVRAVAVTGEGDVLLGTDETLVCLRPG